MGLLFQALTRAEVDPVLDKLREHLITKNVAAEVATQLCKSVAVQMEGQILGSFQRVASVIRETLSDALVQVNLQPIVAVIRITRLNSQWGSNETYNTLNCN